MNAAPEPSVPALIWCPFPSREAAEKIANSLLDEHLIACANIVPGMVSVFEWNGQRGREEETGALLKSNSHLLDKAVARLAQLHPYDDPAILGWRCDSAAPATIAWLSGIGQ